MYNIVRKHLLICIHRLILTKNNRIVLHIIMYVKSCTYFIEHIHKYIRNYIKLDTFLLYICTKYKKL